MSKDFFSLADEFLDSLRDSLEKGFRHFSGNAEFDRSWDELDDLTSNDHTGFGRDLDEFDKRLRDLGHEPKKGPKTQQSQTYTRPFSDNEEKILQLARDYRNLEIEPGLGEVEVKSAYKKMLMKYHPDKFGSDPEKQKVATQITIKVNESYQRILQYLQNRESRP
jgi:DnaJ-class molecular chaperone